MNDDQERDRIWERLKEKAGYGANKNIRNTLRRIEGNVKRSDCEYTGRTIPSGSAAHPEERFHEQVHEVDDQQNKLDQRTPAEKNKVEAIGIATDLGLSVLQKWMTDQDFEFFKTNMDGEKIFNNLEHCQALLSVFSSSGIEPFERWNNTKGQCREDAAMYASFLIYNCLYNYTKLNADEIREDAGKLAKYINNQVFESEEVAGAIRDTNYDETLHDLQGESLTNFRYVKPLTLQFHNERVPCSPIRQGEV